MIKSLSLLFLLLGCGQRTKTTVPWAASKAPVETTVQQKTLPEESETSEPPEEAEELELIPISKYEIASYLSPNNPYSKEYEKFFENQLQIYGRDDNEALVVSRRALLSLGYQRNVYLCGLSSNTLLVISNGLTNQYPLP